MQFVFCTQLFTEKHVHITTPDYVMTLILLKFLCCSFYDKKKNTVTCVNVLKISTHCFFFVVFFVVVFLFVFFCCFFCCFFCFLFFFVLFFFLLLLLVLFFSTKCLSGQHFFIN